MKEFKSIEEQIHLLEDKGLTINNKSDTEKFLLFNNYYAVINGYKDVFLSGDDTFLKAVKFEEIVSLYTFDSRLRLLVLKNSLVIENKIKSLIAYFFSKKYGNEHNHYLRIENFVENEKSFDYIINLLVELRKEIENNRYRDNHIAHYLEKYNNVPLWVLVRLLNFRQINSFYSLMKDGDQKKINVNTGKNGTKNLKTFLRLINGFRNAAAHNERIFNYRVNKTIIAKDLNFFSKEYSFGRNNFYTLVVVFKKILSEEEFRSFFEEFSREFDFLEKNINEVSFMRIKNEMGLPDNWKDVLSL